MPLTKYPPTVEWGTPLDRTAGVRVKQDQTMPRAAGSRATLLVAILATVLSATATQAAADPMLAWVRQVGTSADDLGMGVSADGLGNVYISGYTYGSLGGPNAGGADAFLTKYNAAGTLLWSRQVGTSANDYAYGVSADGLGNVYVSGSTWGSLGSPNAGSNDAFLTKYNAAGTLLWSRQVGTSADDLGMSVSADGLGNVYISGYTYGSLGGPNAGSYDAFLTKYDAAGTFLWSRQIGTSGDDRSLGVSADGLGNVYISGLTTGSLGGPNAGAYDAFLTKYDAAGTLLWSRQVGASASDISYGVSADGLGNVYISGYTGGSLGGPNAGSYDAFLTKYNAAGTLLWSRQVGTSASDESYVVSADSLGNIYISGRTDGSLGGPNAGGIDAFLTKYNAAGTLLWSRQVGTSGDDRSLGVSADGLGNIYISGYTQGSLGGANAGGYDAFLASYGEPILATSPAGGGTLQFGYVLVGQTATRSLSATNNGGVGSQLNGTFPAASGEFAPGATSAFGPLARGAGASRNYTYTPAARGADSLSVTVTSDDGNSTLALSGTGVAPQQQTTLLSNAGLVRIGTSGAAQIRVTNAGDGNLSGLGAVSNLRGDIALLAGSPPEFTGGTAVNLADGASQTYTYTYTPTAHGPQQATVRADFLNGSSDGANLPEILDVIISGQGVGPVFDSSTPPGGTIDFGAVILGGNALRQLAVSNASTDPNGGNPALTNLTLLAAELSGPDAALFSLIGFSAGTVIGQGAASFFDISFSALGPVGAKSAVLTLTTDEGAPFGEQGATFAFNLTGLSVPEPATMGLLLGGLASLARRQWRRARAA